MGIVNIANMCSHLQNASMARLGLTSIKNTKYNLKLALALHRTGYISSITRAGPKPPPEAELLTGTHLDEPVTTANVATRRLWLGLKYWENKPVLRKLKVYTTPKRPVTLQVRQLEQVTRGRSQGQVKGLNTGESLFLATDQGVLEAREALEKRVGGLILCTASS